VSNIAELAPDVLTALPALERDGGLLPEHDVDAALQAARDAAVAELRAEGARRAADGDEVSGLLARLADHLEQQRVAAGVDRLVHELLSDLLTDALAAAEAERPAYLAARAFALKVIARHAPLWPGAGPRLGCAYGYDSVLAVVRRSAEATGA
jgi:hypothetical protein